MIWFDICRRSKRRAKSAKSPANVIWQMRLTQLAFTDAGCIFTLKLTKRAVIFADESFSEKANRHSCKRTGKEVKRLGIQHQQRTQQIKLYSRTALGACLQKQHICWNCLDWHPYKNIAIDNSVVFECVKVLLSKLHAGKLLVNQYTFCIVMSACVPIDFIMEKVDIS